MFQSGDCCSDLNAMCGTNCKVGPSCVVGIYRGIVPVAVIGVSASSEMMRNKF